MPTESAGLSMKHLWRMRNSLVKAEEAEEAGEQGEKVIYLLLPILKQW
ncbi:MAG: hypothetical protein HC930_06675 [Hydrococcus sp. SU_1_0]|nr:hypothetical protein [Hydrococcus sp. SU_1_0]